VISQNCYKKVLDTGAHHIRNYHWRYRRDHHEKVREKERIVWPPRCGGHFGPPLWKTFLEVFMNLNVQSDLITYFNEYLPSVIDYENTATAAFGSVSGENYTDDLTMSKMLTGTVIPNYRKLVEELNEFPAKLKTAEVRELNAKYREAAETTMNGFLMLENILDNQNADKVEEANSILEKGRLLAEKWVAEFQSVCEENDVQL
jgi:hypothetical protein